MTCEQMMGQMGGMMGWMMGLPMIVWTVVGLMLIVLLFFAIRRLARS